MHSNLVSLIESGSCWKTAGKPTGIFGHRSERFLIVSRGPPLSAVYSPRLEVYPNGTRIRVQNLSSSVCHFSSHKECGVHETLKMNCSSKWLPVSFLPQSPTYRTLITCGAEDEEPIVFRECIPSCYTQSPFMSFLLGMERPPSQESTLTDVSLSDSLFSKLSENSEAESHVVELLPTKAESAGALPDTPFSPVLDHVRELKRPPAPLLYPRDTSTQPTPKLPQMKFLDPLRPARRPQLGHVPPAKTRVPTGTRDLPIQMAAVKQHSQV